MRNFGTSVSCNLENEKPQREHKIGIKKLKSCHLRPFRVQLTVT